MTIKDKYPAIAENNWWLIREQFQVSLPTEVNSTYVKTVLGVGSEKTAENVIGPLKTMKIIDQDGKVLKRAKDWRDDKKYKSVCIDIIHDIYPKEIVSLFLEGNLDLDKVTSWFINKYSIGENQARRCAKTYILLRRGTVEKTKRRTSKRSVKSSKAKDYGTSRSELFPTLITHKGLRKKTEQLYKDGHFSSAVEDAYKYLDSYLKKIVSKKDKNVLSMSGAKLMEYVFSLGNPIIAFNDLSSTSEKDEQKGFMKIFAGCMTGIRNPCAHETDWINDENRSLELIIFANHLIEKIDAASQSY